MTKPLLPASKNQRRRQALFWVGLALLAGVPRVLAALLVPNPDGDAYAYFESIDILRASFVAGTFSLKELFGFWLPLYQVIAAVFSVFIDHPMYVSKLVSAACGTGVCLLVFCLSRRLTNHQGVALLAFALVALNPLHVFYSAFTLTDVPHAFFVLASLYAVIKQRWTAAAIFAMLAGLIRVDSWMLVALIPALQFYLERKVALVPVCILMFGPLLWLYICWTATGNPFEYFAVRNSYVNDTLVANPELRSFSLARIYLNLRRVLLAANPAVLAGGLLGAWFIIKRKGRSKSQPPVANRFAVVAVGAFFFAFLSFLVASFVTNNQPDIWERYGLILFVLGAPFSVWAVRAALAAKPRWAQAMTGLVALACLWQLVYQIPYIPGFFREGNPKQILANRIRDRCKADPEVKIFCDDARLPALATIAPEKVLGSSASPTERQAFLTHLRQTGATYLLYEDREGSIPSRLFPELSQGNGNEFFELASPATPKDWHGRVWLYHLRETQQPRE